MWPLFSRPERRSLRVAAALAGGVALLALLLVLRAVVWLDEPLRIRAPQLLELPPGGNLTTLAADLERLGMLDHPLWLRAYARVARLSHLMRAGEYAVEPGITPRGLLRMLVAGDVVQYPVTIIEGTTVAQLLATLHRLPKLEATLRDVPASQLLRHLGIESTPRAAEGLFFPDTYQYHLGMSDADLLRTAYQQMRKVLGEEWAKRDTGLPYRDAYQALIMASLVEKETGVGDERAQIAGVFVRRLRSGMLLQTDPSVIYGLGATFDGNLTREHLRAANPYNTYLNPGLPPTPIALPGRAAIVAALHPAAGDALYFVARGDGTHEFSASLDEHNRAVRRLQVRQRSDDYRSRPDK